MATASHCLQRKTQVKIRLEGIDSPELKQPFVHVNAIGKHRKGFGRILSVEVENHT
jgi:endonuclease YncB( thermonuclease family)